MDIGCEINPGSPEWNHPSLIEPRTIGMSVFVKKDTRRALQLTHNYTLSTIDDKRTSIGHEGDISEVNFLLNGMSILGTIKLICNMENKPNLQRDSIGDAPFHTLFRTVL